MKRAGAVLILTAAILTACGTKGDHDNMNMNHSGHGDQAQPSASHAHGGHDGAAAIAAADVTAKWTIAGGQPAQAKQDTLIRVELAHDGQPIEQFDLNHEEKQHMIIVSKDLSYFHHIHPAYKGKGAFEVTNVFPAGGDYKLIADFVPTGGSAMNKMTWVHVEGDPAATVPIEPDAELTQVVDGKRITLAFDKLAAKEELMLTYTITDDKTQEPITDLQPYLGAVGHVVILTEDAEQYLHVHPMEEKASGPKAEFMTTFPKSGIYKIWGQFKHKDTVFTVPFVVRVP
ncbi:hypothetical protein [Cohnella nanjingensis]|uniref:Secreted protein n=1 Tax=Cohnella nanjingensis TaxID=1387779 RepID=A0A7X0RU36_9BACL|nr:hypothetical protein [Cohnella nanjingensis]MBB6673707.1 hypothetical protein [Cohnella nanjingensis]